MNELSRGTLKSLLIPGGLLLLGVAVLVESGGILPSVSSLRFLYYAALFAGLFVAWRFQSSRIFFALVAVFLAQTAVSFFPTGNLTQNGQAQVAVSAVGLLLPVNLVLCSWVRERGFTVPGLVPSCLVLFVESVAVAVFCQSSSAARLPLHASGSISVPLSAWLVFIAAGSILLAQFLVFRKPAESALFWALAASFVALNRAGREPAYTAYFATAVCALGIAVIENSYFLAFHDELTALPARRAFNAALQSLEAPYSIAVVDIDHFKKFNDTYGHDVGDQVLQMVASKLARVTGDGVSYRCGGEEFTILFAGKKTGEVLEHLELLRSAIESATFRMRGADRRQAPRGADRRKQKSPGSTRAQRPSAVAASCDLSVTVSIGVAASTPSVSSPMQVMEAADQALYRAKAAGRNRVESAGAGRKMRSKAKGIA